ncbi:3-oxoacyl-ACP synthase III family protein [Pseudochryseolinea flava]|uniref:Ketoacyl-ACP synthase III n=1 Tax=Pseudochryseolinea flava TaxID=2059302 RepID=A0A364Y5C1_9BACT|nr:ketoacyl-ACP synthase III [Pseudochryseolinea flava]RAW02196.1 ketoacyl-ACP synthase III [Pseudochryseolinea flava]
MLNSIIIGTGSCIPEMKVPNAFFKDSHFFENETKVYKSVTSVIEKFSTITGISERRYASHFQVASDLGHHAAEAAIAHAQIDRETLDYIIVAHNFGDVKADTNRVDLVPTLASRIKALLQIKNPTCVAYDLPFGCPGWIEGLIQANYFIRSGDVKRCLVIGTETLSRVIDPHDKDSMLFSDGAGALILEGANSNRGILAHKTETHALHHHELLSMKASNSPYNGNKSDLFLKMSGRKVYEFALTHVPPLLQATLEKAHVPLSEIKKIIIHQANAKMDHAIAERLFNLYNLKDVPDNIMPMTISYLGNSSVATVPTLLDLILKGKMKDHTIQENDKVLFASVGAGMNINAVLYQF